MSEGTATPRVLELGAAQPPSGAILQRLDAQRERIAEALRSCVRRPLRRRCELRFEPPRCLRAAQLDQALRTSAWSASDDGEGQHLLLALPRSLQQCVVDRLLGGPGRDEPSDRAPSPLERELGGEFQRELHAALTDALAAPPLLLRSLEPRLLQEPPHTFLDDPHQSFVVLDAELSTDQGAHRLRLAMSLEALQQDDDGPAPDAVPAAPAQAALQAREVPVDVELARCRLSLEELSQLEAGDLVLFEASPGEAVELRLGDRLLARARLGQWQGRHAVEVLDLIDLPTEEAHDDRA